MIDKPVWGTPPDFADGERATNAKLNQMTAYAEQVAGIGDAFGLKSVVGLVITLKGGAVSGGTWKDEQELELSPSVPNYVELDPATGTASLGAGGFTAGKLPAYYAVADSASITNLNTTTGSNRLDRRSWINNGGSAAITSVNGQSGPDVVLDGGDIDGTLDDTTAFGGTPNTGTINELLGRIGRAFKSITGQTAWVTAPAQSIASLITALSSKADDSAVVHNTGNETVAGIKTFSSSPVIPDAIASNQPASKGQLDAATNALSGEYGPPMADIISLENVDATSIPDKQIRLVESVGAIFRYDSSSSAPADDVGVLQPIAGGGRWFKVQAATQDHEALVNLHGGGTGDHQHLTTAEKANLPTSDEKAALSGFDTSKPPNSTNHYVTEKLQGGATRTIMRNVATATGAEASDGFRIRYDVDGNEDGGTQDAIIIEATDGNDNGDNGPMLRTKGSTDNTTNRFWLKSAKAFLLKLLSVGPGTNTTFPLIEANTAAADGSKPQIRWNSSTSKLQFANDGSTWADFGSGGMANPMTTKGDLIAGGAAGAPTRFPVGIDGQTIVADSTQTVGFKWATPSGGGGTTLARATVTVTTASLADLAMDNVTAALGKTAILLAIEVDRAAWVRVYNTAASRTADASRDINDDPTSATGCLIDLYLTSATRQWLCPAPNIYSGESTPSANLSCAIQNRSGATHTVAVTFTFLALE